MSRVGSRDAGAKSVTQFWPLAAADLETCDRYYREVHARFARRTLRAMSHVRSYHTARAVAAYDLNAGWAAPPETFRYVTLRFDPGRTLGFEPAVREQVSQDHRRFLRGLRPFAVEEEVLLDRLTGQTSLVKYVFEYDRPREERRSVAADRLAAQLGELTLLAGEAFGLRLLLADHVVAEGEVAPLDEPGQAPTGRSLAHTGRQAFLELHFDQREWAEEWFAAGEVRAALAGSGWARVHGVRVEEECGLDRR